MGELDQRLKTALEPITNLHFAFGRHPAQESRLSSILSAVRTGRKSGLGPVSITDPGALLAEMRLHKTSDEIDLMRVGARITDEAHRLSMAQVRPGMYEYEIEALLQYTFRRHGAWGWAYPSIVGGGANACVLHYIENNSMFREGDLMLIDAGAEIDGYATDVTRTSPVSGRFSGPQRDLYALVLTVQEQAIEATKPGATIDAIHDEVVRNLSDGMIQLGLLQGSVDSVIETESFRRYYMHRTSHWLGLDVHDVGRYHDPHGPARALEPGMVITIEPGLYIPSDDEQAPDAFRGTGIRIEDDILVTEDGFDNLTASIPKTPEDIEALRLE
ncbi:MAG TPA: Xaa-Pro aminopeptidase [Deltaproteobacteria bacterium]|nr:Xaa-Pro aminopeptidase [Deltaproteobacteria bacterium]